MFFNFESSDDIDLDDNSEDVESDFSEELNNYNLVDEGSLKYKILFNSDSVFQPLSLEKKKSEINFILARTREKIALMNGSSRVDHTIQLRDLLKLIFLDSEWVNLYVDNINRSLVLQGKPLFGKDEFPLYLEFKFLCHFYNLSPTALATESSRSLCRQPKMESSRFFEIINSLDVSSNTNISSSSSSASAATFTLLDDFEDVFNRFCNLFHKIAYDPSGMVLSLDDDKLRKSSQAFKDVGIKVGFHRGGKKGPTAINVISEHSNIILGGYVLKKDDNNLSGCNIAIASIIQISISKLNLKQTIKLS
jgi:hypothetical protein